MSDTFHAKLVQKRLLLPLSIVLVSLIVGFVYFSIKMQQIHHEKTNQNLLENSIKTFNNALKEQSNSLAALAKIIARDKNLRIALGDQNRQHLLEFYEDVFVPFNKEHSITHFYFHQPDRTNLLRIHKPERHGDLINRSTTLEAERTHKVASGIELGPLGTFTLRVVLPVWEDNILIGYLELGKEIEDILARIHEKQGTELAVTINKKFLDQKKWEEGMMMLGRKAQWNRFSQNVLIYHSQPSYPAEFEPLLKDCQPEKVLSTGVKYQNKIWHGQNHPLNDASGTGVGHLILWYDHTEYHDFLDNLVKKLILGVLLLLLALFIYLWIVLRQTDNIIVTQQTRLIDSNADLEKAHSEMEKLATTDVLTGLANRRFALQALKSLWTESVDNDVPLACLLIDADGFKEVNDSYGHDAGDIVLCELAKHLNYAVRTDDIVCRLGGDEFLILCPSTDKDGLELLANQVHTKISKLTIPVSGGVWQGSISVGAAVKTNSMQGPDSLVKAADNGVYVAKKAGGNCVHLA